MGLSRPRRLLLALSFCFLFAGCGQQAPPLGKLVGPIEPVPVDVKVEHFTDTDRYTITTKHYLIYSTYADRDFNLQLGQLMEGAYPVYQSIAPGIPETHYPMVCYLFANRAQWADYTRK